MAERNLEAEIASARESFKTKTESRQPLRAIAEAREKLLKLEREFCASRNEEYAESIDFPIQWQTGAPLPHLFSNDYKTFLIFMVNEDASQSADKYATFEQLGSEPIESMALVEFCNCLSAKLGSPNDESVSGHRLFGKGLESHVAQRVVNSTWLKEMETTDSVHPYHNHQRWLTKEHFIFSFHDSTFECVAESFKVELYRTSLHQLLQHVCSRFLT
ncbi:MAG TPA: hypothetical protein V6C86_26945 [Oculatellaceae cyanobacterium]